MQTPIIIQQQQSHPAAPTAGHVAAQVAKINAAAPAAPVAPGSKVRTVRPEYHGLIEMLEGKIMGAVAVMVEDLKKRINDTVPRTGTIRLTSKSKERNTTGVSYPPVPRDYEFLVLYTVSVLCNNADFIPPRVCVGERTRESIFFEVYNDSADDMDIAIEWKVEVRQ